MSHTSHTDTPSAPLMDHIEHLSVGVGPRPPGSRAERAAASYIHSAIRDMHQGWELINQPFRTISGFRYRLAPLAALAGLCLFTGLGPNRTARYASGLTSIGVSMLSRDAFLARPAMWESWLPRGESQNVLVRISPRQTATRRIVFLAHIDSGAHRLTADPRFVRHLPRTLGAITLLALTGGVLTLLAGRRQRWWPLRAAFGTSALGGTALAVLDEMGAHTTGANSNASGVAALLGLAAHLSQQPLERTEVVLAFTGSATAVSTGADMLATQYAQMWHAAHWIVVANVGAGELCWVTRHGISPYAHYHPHPDAVRLMERVAEERPDLGLMGRALLTMDEVAILRDRSLRAVALMAYDRASGLIPHWRQGSDTAHAIEPDTVARAVDTLWTAARLIDTESAATT